MFNYCPRCGEKINWKKIKQSCREFIIIQASDDPYVQMRHAEFLHKTLGGKLKIIPNGLHFSVGTGGERFREFPELLEHL